MYATCNDCGQKVVEDINAGADSVIRCAGCTATRRQRLSHEIYERQIVPKVNAMSGMTDSHVASLVKHGYGDVELVVCLRGNGFDDRKILTAFQVQNAPTEIDELIHRVTFLSGL